MEPKAKIETNLEGVKQEEGVEQGKEIEIKVDNKPISKSAAKNAMVALNDSIKEVFRKPDFKNKRAQPNSDLNKDNPVVKSAVLANINKKGLSNESYQYALKNLDRMIEDAFAKDPDFFVSSRPNTKQKARNAKKEAQRLADNILNDELSGTTKGGNIENFETTPMKKHQATSFFRKSEQPEQGNEANQDNEEAGKGSTSPHSK